MHEPLPAEDPELKASGVDQAGTLATGRVIRVWDLPVRLFHWLLVALVVISIITGNVGGVWEMELHLLAGSAVLALVLFRVAWGLAGSSTARFSGFVRGPRTVIAYLLGLLAGGKTTVVGHNPLGGWSVVAMLSSLALQAITGLFSNDDILTKGPLAKYVSKRTSDLITEVHEANASVLYVLVTIHLTAVIGYYLFKRENLVRPMITGRKTLPADADAAAPRLASPWLALVLALAAAAVVWRVVTL